MVVEFTEFTPNYRSVDQMLQMSQYLHLVYW